eukprot:TRINITY_DN5857_c0_g1_i1.p1 TRINITY_DN5857_c0_g1~~TRINITY_DN5857_c0_g1_i1.p1  ORF type:complete len:100 (-),score=27.53 TRINITY_DN5857_c0_g1_i1:162-431(-)
MSQIANQVLCCCFPNFCWIKQWYQRRVREQGKISMIVVGSAMLLNLTVIGCCAFWPSFCRPSRSFKFKPFEIQTNTEIEVVEKKEERKL